MVCKTGVFGSEWSLIAGSFKHGSNGSVGGRVRGGEFIDDELHVY